jgi:hypothetical protein
MIKTPNNQPRVGRSGRGVVIAEAGGGVAQGENPIQSFWAANGTTKINNIKCIMAFGGCWLIILHTTTNQKWAGDEEERVEKRDKCWGMAEGCQCTMSACGR